MPLTVLKLGGSLLRESETLGAAAAALERMAGGRHAVVVVTGGGALADAVRALDQRLGLGDDAAHWMAVLAMDQGAHLLAARVPGAAIVEEPAEIRAAIADGVLPVLAPYRWLRRADPLPHSWDVTSDSIAAWVAGELGAARLVLIKMAAGEPVRLADPYFPRALPAGVEAVVLGVDALDRIERLLID